MMKESHIPWVGLIPDTWQVKRGKAILSLLERTVEPDDKVVTCFRDGKVTLRSNRREDGFTISLQETGYQGIEPGDLVVHGMDGFAGAIGISDSRGKGTPVLNVLDSSQNKRFIMYYLRNMAYTGVFLSLSTGIRVRSCDTNWSKLKNLPYLIPPMDQQDAIADYLDAQCARIDIILEEIRWSIEEYKTLKQAIITQAVTKGLKHSIEMKDSGIKWIGTIPAHWKLEKLRNHTSMLTPMRDRPERLDGKIPWIRIEDYDGKYISTSKDGLGVSEETVKAMNLKIYPIGTVLCTSSCDLGKCAIVSRELVSNQRFIGIIPNNGTCPDFLYYLMVSNAERLNFLSTGTIQANLSRKEFEQLYVQFPPYSEQVQIANYLDAQCEIIDGLLLKKQALILSLEEYKKSLIFEYVTGKKKVPQSYPKSIITFIDARALLMCRIIELLKPKGRIHLMKALFCVDCLLDFNRETQYLRQKHGPYDERIEEYEKVLLQKGWASIKNGNSVDYILTETFETYREAYQIYYGNVDAEIQRICEFLRPMKTSQAERVATLLAVWNDFIIDGITPTDKQIVQEVRSNWTPNKANSPESTWMDTLTKMKTYHITPSGYGKHTAHMNENR